jgi:16S rRNA processing protein RimM
VLRPFGLRGEVKAEPLTDFPERFAPGARLWVGGVECTVERSRVHRGDLYLKLHGFESAEAAESIRDALLEVPEAMLHPLEDDTFYHHQLEGLTVRATTGETLGPVREILEPGPNPVLVVAGGRGEILIPFIEDVVRRVDIAGGVIEIELIEGLLPEERAPRTRPAIPPWARRRRRPAAPSP